MGKSTIALFSFAYLLALLVNTPASLLDKYLQHASQGRLALANVSGTLWHGVATPAIRTQEGALVVLHPLRWKIIFASLFNGKIKAQLQWDEPSSASPMDAFVSFNQIELHHVLLRFPARLLSEVSIMLKPAQFHGQIQLQSERLIFSRHGIDGAAIADWQHAGSALGGIDPLGNYRLALNCTGNRINIALTTNSGILLLDGQGSWLAGRGLEFYGRAKASSGNYDSLKELLHYLGPEESVGVHSINLKPQ